MKALITGGNGFIGSYLVEALLQRGYDVRCMIRKTSNLQWIKNLDVEFVYGTLSDVSSLEQAVSNIQVVFHLAGKTKGLHSDNYFRVNTDGTKNLLDVCSGLKPQPPKFIFASSLAAAGPSVSRTKPKTELDDPTPTSIYGKSKLAAEHLVHSYMKSAPAVIIRPPAVYGPRDTDFLKFFQMINRGICPIIGFRDRELSIVHVYDLVDGIIRGAENNQANGNIYFICNEEGFKWYDLGELAASVLKKRTVKLRIPSFTITLVAFFSELIARIHHKPAIVNFDKARDGRQLFWLCENKLAQKDLGFEPKISLDAGIQETLHWYEQQGWLR